MRGRSRWWFGGGLCLLVACDGGSETDAKDSEQVEDTEVDDSPITDASDEQTDTDPPVDTEVPVDTDVLVDTEVPVDTEVAVDTEVPVDTDETDETDETDDTDPLFLGIVPGTYYFDAVKRWVIGPGGATTSNVMLVWMTLEVDALGGVSGTLYNAWTINEVTVNATCGHAVTGSLVYSLGPSNTTVQVTLDTIGNAVCDTPPDSAFQYAWTDAMRGNFGWFGLVPVEDIDAAWAYAGGINIADRIETQITLGQDIQFLALVEGTGDYYLPDAAVSPNAFFGAVERL